jgi:hypothetical protein
LIREAGREPMERDTLDRLIALLFLVGGPFP